MTKLALVPTARHKHQLEFLPAALEVVETPPRPAGRAILWLILTFFTVAVVWACIGQVDIVAVARGKVAPAGHVKTIQPLEIGTVRAIHVGEGAQVEAGDLLVELDPTQSEADYDRIKRELQAAKGALTRTNALLAWLGGDNTNRRAVTTAKALALTFPPDVPSDVALMQQRLYDNQVAEQMATQMRLDTAILKAHAQHATLREQVAKLKAVLPLIVERARAVKTLSKQKLISRTEFLTLEQERIEHVQDLKALERQSEEAKQTIAEAKAEREQIHATFKGEVLREKTELAQRLHGLSQEKTKAQQRNALQRLTAPVSGVVQQLSVHTVGGVVTPAQILMTIVPTDAEIYVEALFQNKDIGFIEPGQSVEVKIDAFPFTQHGAIEGTLTMLSQDAVEQEGAGWVFPARITLHRSSISVHGRSVGLTAGMSVGAEVSTGQRHIIEFVLAPLVKHFSESARER